jgi:hypothetical protein
VSDYRAALTCRRCGCIRYVSKLAEKFIYWHCHRRDDEVRCGTDNVWN